MSSIIAVSLLGTGIASIKENNFNIQSQCKKSTDFLFILSAKKAKVMKLYGENQYELRVNKLDFHEPVIGFSDRSLRSGKHLTMLQLIKKWEEKGKDAFKDVPPNGSLSANNIEGFIITLNKRPSFDQISQSYIFTYHTRDKILEKKLYHITMTIDAFNLECVYDG